MLFDMRKIIISGEDNEIDKLIRENRIRFDRGTISMKEVGNKAPSAKQLDKSDTKELDAIGGKSKNGPTV